MLVRVGLRTKRLRDWQQAGVWDLMHFVMLNWLSRYGQIDWSRAVCERFLGAANRAESDRSS